MIVLSKYGFDDVLGEYIKLDPSRVAAGIVTAIGFLGSGMILSKNNNIIGLTTSAGIWATVGVGMAMGAGLYLIGILTTVMVIFSELFLGRKNNVTDNVEVERDIEIEYIEEVESEINVSAILQSGFHENGFQVEKVQIKRQDNGITKIIISVCSDEKTNPFFLTELMDRYKEIIKVSL
jgi:putative Mg2+ transporter-C (MgtC) family protein